jgi:hypothetical protein
MTAIDHFVELKINVIQGTYVMFIYFIEIFDKTLGEQPIHKEWHWRCGSSSSIELGPLVTVFKFRLNKIQKSGFVSGLRIVDIFFSTGNEREEKKHRTK